MMLHSLYLGDALCINDHFLIFMLLNDIINSVGVVWRAPHLILRCITNIACIHIGKGIDMYFIGQKSRECDVVHAYFNVTRSGQSANQFVWSYDQTSILALCFDLVSTLTLCVMLVLEKSDRKLWVCLFDEVLM